MDAAGVDRQILSAIPHCMYYTFDAGLCAEIAASFNHHLAELSRTLPDRFSCMATVPLQDPEAAARELERAVSMGHIGVEIGSNVAGKNLDDPGLDVFWQKVVSLDIPVLIHPIDIMGLEDRMKDYYLANLIGNPLDTTIAAACLTFGGVMERFPNLKVLLSHTGGFTPWIRGRWQHGYIERRSLRAGGPGLRKIPSGNSITTLSSIMRIALSLPGRPSDRTRSSMPPIILLTWETSALPGKSPGSRVFPQLTGKRSWQEMPGSCTASMRRGCVTI